MRKFNFLNIMADNDEVEIRISGEIMSNGDKEMYEKYWDLKDGESPDTFRAKLKENEGKPIKLYVDSVGGDVFAASSMYTSLLEYKNNVTAIVSGVAASAASFLIMAANKIVIAPTAQIMIHNPMTYAVGDQREMRHTADVLDSIKESIINAYEKKTGKSREEISELMDKETWMDAHFAVDMGFADEILETNEETSEEVISNIFNLRKMVFNKAFKKPEPIKKVKDDIAQKAISEFDFYANN